jgi:hypothetical protein
VCVISRSQHFGVYPSDLIKLAKAVKVTKLHFEISAWSEVGGSGADLALHP